MNLYGKHTSEVADRIVNAFRNPEILPKALAPIFIHRGDESVPCRKWSISNQMLCAFAGTADARGIQQWNDAGRKVKTGTKAFWILAPIAKKIEDKETGEDRVAIFGFKSVPVFRAEDTEGESLPYTEETEELRQWLRELPLSEVAETWGLSLGTYGGNPNGALGFYQHGFRIMLGVKNLSTWAHELVHAADDRLGLLQGSSKIQREIVAELGGAVLLETLGLSEDADLGGAFQYISHWADNPENTVHQCCKVLDRVAKCVNLILESAQAIQGGNEMAVAS